MAHRIVQAGAALATGVVLMLPTPAFADSSHDQHDHGTTPDDDPGHADHGTQPAEVSPDVRNLVLSGFAGVNAAVIFGAWMVRRTGPDPDPRKRSPKAAR